MFLYIQCMQIPTSTTSHVSLSLGLVPICNYQCCIVLLCRYGAKSCTSQLWLKVNCKLKVKFFLFTFSHKWHVGTWFGPYTQLCRHQGTQLISSNSKWIFNILHSYHVGIYCIKNLVFILWFKTVSANISPQQPWRKCMNAVTISSVC